MRAFRLALTVALLLTPTGLVAQSQTPYEACTAQLEVASSDELLAFRTCFYEHLSEIGAALPRSRESLTAARQRYAAMARADDDFYLVSAANCEQERASRARLEESALQLSSGIESLETLIETVGRFPGNADTLLIFAAERGLIAPAADLVAALNSGPDTAEYVQLVTSSRETLNDIRSTDVENRCGSAEPLPDTPTPPLGSESETREMAGFSGTHSETEWGDRYDDLQFEGMAVNGCRSAANCGGEDTVRDEVCRRMGYQQATGSAFRSHGDVETVNLWSGSTYPPGSSVLAAVVCRGR